MVKLPSLTYVDNKKKDNSINELINQKDKFLRTQKLYIEIIDMANCSLKGQITRLRRSILVQRQKINKLSKEK